MNVQWKNDEPETFTLLNICWNVQKAKSILKAKKDIKVESVSVTEWSKLLGGQKRGNTITMGVGVDWERAEKATDIDLSVPVILVHHSKIGPFIIDGWHRVAKASLEGVSELPAIMLTKAESKRILL